MYECKPCNFSTSRPYDLKRHMQSKRHITIEYKNAKQTTNKHEQNYKLTVGDLNNDDSNDS